MVTSYDLSGFFLRICIPCTLQMMMIMMMIIIIIIIIIIILIIIIKFFQIFRSACLM